MPSIPVTILVVLLSILAGIYQLYVKPILDVFGVSRTVQPVGTRDCITIPELQACEKIVLHQPTGVLYLACSTPSSRTHWVPSTALYNTTGASFSDYLATYDPKTKHISHLDVKSHTSGRGFSSHGMDVVPSSSNPKELFIYLINHRAPLNGADPWKVGADSSVEIFKVASGSQNLVHQTTVEHPLMISPNDIVGSPDGKSFHFTNDIGNKVGTGRVFFEFMRPTSSVVYCHVDNGCKYAASKMLGNNGITKGKNDTFYVASALSGKLSVLEKQVDNTLVLTDLIPAGRCMDNLSIDDDGIVWAIGFPKVLDLIKHMHEPSIKSPSAALKFSINTGPAAFYGEKFKVETAFEDDGSLVSGATSVVHDSQRGRLFFHGIASPWLTVCQYKN